jgi:ADP-ribose pyrophosphatase YjhB (NUDIX family)
MKKTLSCPHCNKPVASYRNPVPTVDIIIEMGQGIKFTDHGIRTKSAFSTGYTGGFTDSADDPGTGTSVSRIVLIRRKNYPFGWAIPGGFVDYGESLEKAALREAEEETSLKVELLFQLGAYSDPSRDPRQHTISVVFVARGEGTPVAADDAEDVGVFDCTSIPKDLAFDHRKIIRDYYLRLDSI